MVSEKSDHAVDNVAGPIACPITPSPVKQTLAKIEKEELHAKGEKDRNML
jgi:hypothetical protein